MYKRIIALMLSLLMLAAVLPVGVSAEETEDRMIRDRIADHYVKALEMNESESLNGLCGALASYQLYLLGVNSYPIMANGNDQYDCYLEKDYTDKGYMIKRYPSTEYTLEEALNAITHHGTWNAYNILVGFHSTTTQAGSLYGHAVVIYAIVDGRVYFTESYGSSFVREEGAPTVCTISQFAAFYNDWTKLEGVILFGQKDYLDNCNRNYTNMYVQVDKEEALYTQPCTPDSGETESYFVRTARKGEYLWVTALYENTLGEFYYRVQDGQTVCYVNAASATPMRFNTEDVIVSEMEFPEVLTPGKDFTVAGKITAQHNLVGGITMTVTDQEGEIILTHSRAKKSGSYDLSKDTFNKVIDFGILEEGLYTYTLTADVLSDCLIAGEVGTNLEKIDVCKATFAVGEKTRLPQQGRLAPDFVSDGWSFVDDRWCYYEQGVPRTGWFCYDGVDYYLQEDGSVTTGWAEINGKDRYFTSLGAMCTGWLHTEEGVWYLLKNGQKAIGLRKIEDQLYFFGENGQLETGWQTIDEKTYFFQPDGSAATGWNELEDGIFYFSKKGLLLAKAIINGQEVTYEMLTEEQVTIPPLEEETE